jgi:hypothetical protein
LAKNGLEARKLQPLKIRGSFLPKKILNQTSHSLFPDSLKKKSLKKYYCVAYSVVLPLELQDDL